MRNWTVCGVLFFLARCYFFEWLSLGTVGCIYLQPIFPCNYVLNACFVSTTTYIHVHVCSLWSQRALRGIYTCHIMFFYFHIDEAKKRMVHV